MRYAFAFVLAAATTALAADLPYEGKWKLNVAKSNFGETTITFSQTSSGQMQFTAAGQSYTFQVDGKDYPSLFGQTAAWKKLDANTWETAVKLNGKLLSTDTTKLAADGKTLTMNTKGPKPAGGTFDETVVYERVSGGPELAGRWKTKNIKTSSPTTLELAASGNGLLIRIADFQITCDAKFDGKDYPATGPTLPPGLTLAIQKAGPRSFALTEKLNGKPIFTLTFTVSVDGKTLREEGGATGVNEKFTGVYDRQ